MSYFLGKSLWPVDLFVWFIWWDDKYDCSLDE